MHVRYLSFLHLFLFVATAMHTYYARCHFAFATASVGPFVRRRLVLVARRHAHASMSLEDAAFLLLLSAESCLGPYSAGPHGGPPGGKARYC